MNRKLILIGVIFALGLISYTIGTFITFPCETKDCSGSMSVDEVFSTRACALFDQCTKLGNGNNPVVATVASQENRDSALVNIGAHVAFWSFLLFVFFNAVGSRGFIRFTLFAVYAFVSLFIITSLTVYIRDSRGFIFGLLFMLSLVFVWAIFSLALAKWIESRGESQASSDKRAYAYLRKHGSNPFFGLPTVQPRKKQ